MAAAAPAGWLDMARQHAPRAAPAHSYAQARRGRSLLRPFPEAQEQWVKRELCWRAPMLCAASSASGCVQGAQVTRLWLEGRGQFLPDTSVRVVAVVHAAAHRRAPVPARHAAAGNIARARAEQPYLDVPSRFFSDGHLEKNRRTRILRRKRQGWTGNIHTNSACPQNYTQLFSFQTETVSTCPRRGPAWSLLSDSTYFLAPPHPAPPTVL